MTECPMCHYIFDTPKLKCGRCNHQWVQRATLLPKVCPKCKSPYWNKRRKKELSKSYSEPLRRGVLS